MQLLIFRGGALGDFLLTLPAMEALRKRWPQAHITLVSKPAYGALLKTCGMIHATINLESAEISSLFNRPDPSSPTPPWLTAFDHAIAWMTDPDGNFTHHLKRAIPSARLLNPVLRAFAGRHASWQLSESIISPPMPPTLLAEFYGEAELHPTSQTLAVHIGSGSAQKNWPPQRWAEMLTTWHHRIPETSILLISGEADESATEEVRTSLSAADVPFAEARNLPLPELAAALGRCHLYVGHDTGVSHLAAVCGVRSLWLFGPTDPKIWAPLHANVHVLKASEGALSNLTVEAVLSALESCSVDDYSLGNKLSP